MLRLSKTCFFGFVVGLFGVVVSLFPLIHQAEKDSGLGLLFKLRGARTAPSDVVVVGIDRKSSEYFRNTERLKISENPSQWPRSLHARLVKKLTAAGARVIVFDVYFTEPRSPKEDSFFAETIKKARTVILAKSLQREDLPAGSTSSELDAHKIVKTLRPIPALAQAAIATASFVLPRVPIKVHQYWTFEIEYQDGHRTITAGDAPTFPVVALQIYALPVYGEFVRLFESSRPDLAGRLPPDALAAIQSKGAVRFMRDIRAIFESDPTIADKMLRQLKQTDPASRDPAQMRLLKSLIELYSGSNQRYINFYGPPRSMQTVSFHEALEGSKVSGTVQNVDFRDKAVFIGLSEAKPTESGDTFHTVFSQANGVFISGVEIAATAFANLLEDRPIRQIGSYRYLLTILVWGILIGVICRTASTLVGAFAVVGLSGAYFAGASYQFKTADLWYPIIVPLLFQTPLGFFGALLWNYFETNKERQNVRKALSYYVPDEVVDQLAQNIVDIKKGGQTEYGVCLFSDAEGYTGLSESMQPRELGAFMHKYFEATFEPVKKNGGRVIDLEGDSILALWKGTRPEAVLRRQACFAALGVAKAVREFNQSNQTFKLSTRIGLHAGQIFLTNMGAGDHYKYGPTGDTVNTASRMEGLNKYLGTGILVTEEVIRDLDDFLLREAGKFRVKGKAQAVGVYELICRLEECEETQKRACDIFAQGVEAFQRRAWLEAEDRFYHCIEQLGEDKLSCFYLDLCERYKQSPPGEIWDGAIPMDEK